MKTHPYRISEAAVGKIYAELIGMTRRSEISSEQFHDTMFAAFIYIENEKEPATDAKVSPAIWQQLKAKIDKSAKRSAAARIRAAKRKEEKQSLISGAAKSASGLIDSYSRSHPNHPLTAEKSCVDDAAGIDVTAPAVSPMAAPQLKEVLPLLSPENQMEFLRMEQEKFEYAKEQERLRKEEAKERERKRIEDEKIAEKKRKEELERKREEMDAFVSWQLAGRPPTNRRFNIF